MKRYILLLVLLSAFSAFADDYVQGHTRRDGTYVPPHMRTDPN